MAGFNEKIVRQRQIAYNKIIKNVTLIILFTCQWKTYFYDSYVYMSFSFVYPVLFSIPTLLENCSANLTVHENSSKAVNTCKNVLYKKTSSCNQLYKAKFKFSVASLRDHRFLILFNLFSTITNK